MNGKQLSHLCKEACEKNQPLLVQRGDIIKLQWVEPPLPQVSFGLIDNWVTVRNDVQGTFSKLVIPFKPERLGWVKRETLRLFRYDPKKKSIEKVEGTLPHPKHPAVYAAIEKPGVYGLIGLHTHPLVQRTIRLLCELKPIVAALPKDAQDALRDRYCELILCARDMDQFFESRDRLVNLVKDLEGGLPKDMPSPLPRLAIAGETICDRCHGVDIVDFPDCHVLEPEPEGPCKSAIWENVGPNHISGAMRQIVIDPTDRRRLYAVSANGGIWRLNNVDEYPETKWLPLTDGLTNLRFRTMAVAPGHSSTLYAANSVKELGHAANSVKDGRYALNPVRELRADTKQVYSEIYRSVDRGRNWNPIQQARMGVVHRIVVHPTNPDVVYAATSTGLWLRSETIGEWINLRLNTPPDDCLDVVLDPDDSSIIYLGVRNHGIFKSFTSGAKWSPSPILSFDATAAGDNRQAIKIALGRWLNADKQPQARTGRTLVVRFGNEINVSQTGGDDPNGWQRIDLLKLGGNISESNLEAGNIRRSDSNPPHKNEWCNCLVVDPFDPQHILVGSVGILESRDGGQTWTDPVYPHHEDQHSLAFDEVKPNLVYVACDGGIFSSIDGGTSWPPMGLPDTTPAPGRGTCLSKGLITSEFRHTAIHDGRCVAAIDHTGYILSEDFGDRWQFLFKDPDVSDHHAAGENGYIFPCPASRDRWYVFNMGKKDDPENIQGRLAQFDFTRNADGLVNPPATPFTGFLSTLQAPVFEKHVIPGDYFPEDAIYNANLPGPFAIRFSKANDERLILFATVTGDGDNEPYVYNVQSLKLASNGTNVNDPKIEADDSAVPFTAIAFVPNGPDWAFAVTRTGTLFKREFSSMGDTKFSQISQWALPAGASFISQLVPVSTPDLKVYLLTQNAIGRYDDDDRLFTPILTWPDMNERLMSLVAHPNRGNTLFLGTSRGVYLSEDEGANWESYSQGMPAVPITHLSFDQGYLYAASFGRGLWRCRPCPA